MNKKIPFIGLVTCVLYFVVVGVFIITQSALALTLWELFTIVGSLIILLVLLEVSSYLRVSSTGKHLVSSFMVCCIALTSLAHVLNLAVTRKLLNEGIDIPSYLQMGYWPSVEMAVDYLAWGFFAGLSFCFSGFFSTATSAKKNQLKKILIGSGILCLIGFFGSILVNENLWYIAPIGYGLGTILLCVKILRQPEDA